MLQHYDLIGCAEERKLFYYLLIFITNEPFQTTQVQEKKLMIICSNKLFVNPFAS